MTRLLGFAIFGGLLFVAANPSFAVQINQVDPADGRTQYCLDIRGITNLPLSTTVEGTGTTADKKVALRICDQSAAQQFLFTDGMIRATTGGKCLELGPEEVVGNNKVRLLMTNTCANKGASLAQEWRIGKYIENGSTDLQQCLASIGGVKTGARLGMVTCSSAKYAEKHFWLR